MGRGFGRARHGAGQRARSGADGAIIALHRPPAPGPTIKQTRSLTQISRYPEPGAACYSVTVHLEQERRSSGRDSTPVRNSRRSHRGRRGARHAAGAADASDAAGDHRSGRRGAGGDGGRGRERLTDEAAEQSGDRVEFADDAAFERRYLVLSPEYGPARVPGSKKRRQELVVLEGVQISLDGSLMLVSSPTDAIRHRDRSLEESLRAELENARRVLKIFG